LARANQQADFLILSVIGFSMKPERLTAVAENGGFKQLKKNRSAP